MRQIRLIPVVAALAAAAACGSDASSAEDERTPDPEGSTVDLDVTVRADLGAGHSTGQEYPPEADGLVADYTVTNNADVPILVAERRGDIPARDIGRPLPDDEETTWIYTADDGVVQLTKEMFPVLDDRERGEAYTVPAQRVHPGESIDGRAFALLPLTAVVPASDEFEVPGSDELSPEATAWRFCVQVAPDPETRDEAVIFDYTPDRRLLCSDEAELPSGALGDG